MLTPRQLFLNHIAQTSDIPLGIEAERAEGCYIYDIHGKTYLDLIAGISVSNLGHCHPEVVKAVKDQLDKYMHLMVYGEYIQSPQVQFAKLLVDNLPESLNCVFFTNSGTEAVEGAMKLAKRYTGRYEMISCHNAYHGSTQGAMSIAGGEWLKDAFRPLLPGNKLIRFNNFEDIDQITNQAAAVFIEPIQGEAGALIPDNNYLNALRKKCTETGTLLIFDEIQTGGGRTGSLWAFEQFEIVPDVLLLGKSIGGGMPLAAFISDKKIMHELSHNPVLGHITTFGGHPVCCAAGKAAFEVLIHSDLVLETTQKEKLFREKLKHKNIKAIHGKGLLLAMELADFAQVQKVIRHCIANGVITDWFLFNDFSVRIAPPLIITEKQIDDACRVILEAVDTL